MRGLRRGRSDRELIQALRAGSSDAAEEIVRRYMPDAYRAAYYMTGNRQLAEDVVQDAFERALRSINSYDLDRPFGPWLHRIVTNRSVDILRSQQFGIPLDETKLAARDPYQAADDSRELLAALGELSDERRTVVVLRLLFGYAPEEVAEIIGVEVGTVHSRLSRGLADLRSRIEVSDAV